jgi:hypothetical protein
MAFYYKTTCLKIAISIGVSKLPLALANGSGYITTRALAQKLRTKVPINEAYIPLAKANCN